MGAEIPSLAELLAQPLAERGYVASGFASAHLVDVQAYGDEVAVAAPTADAMYENGAVRALHLDSVGPVCSLTNTAFVCLPLLGCSGGVGDDVGS